MREGFKCIWTVLKNRKISHGCGNWLGLVNSGVYYARQTRESSCFTHRHMTQVAACPSYDILQVSWLPTEQYS